MKNFKKYYSLLLLLFLIIGSCAKDEIKTDNQNDYESLMNKHLKNYEIITIDYDQAFNEAIKKPTSYVSLNLNIESHPDWEFKVKNDDLDQYFAPDFKMIEIGSGDRHIEHEMHEVYAMEGYLKKPDQQVIVTFGLGRMEAIITDGVDEYSLEPLFNYDQNAPKDQYVLYKGIDVIDNNYNCTTEKGDSTNEEDKSSLRNAAGIWKVNLTYLGDYQFYQKYYNTSNAYNYMYWRFYYGNKRYNAYNYIGLNWQIRSAYLYSWSGSANYNPKTASNKTTFVRECSDFYNYSWYNEGDVNYFFTGDDVSGVIGKADGIARMCNNPSKAFSFGEWRASTYQAQNLMAHEVGHTMGCHHDLSSNNFMNTYSSKWNYTIGVNARHNINWYLNNNTCLSQ